MPKVKLQAKQERQGSLEVEYDSIFPIIFNQMMTQYQQITQNIVKNSERDSNATDCTDFEEEDNTRFANIEMEDSCCYRADLFLQKTHKKPSRKLNRSAVGWIQTNCFVKGFDLEVNVLAVSLYYSYISVKPIDKSRLQLLLSTVIFMAQKFCGPHSMTHTEVLELLSGEFSSDDLIQIEAQIFEIMGMDLIVETVFEFVVQENLPSHIQNGVFFLLELLLLQDPNVMFDEQKTRNIISLVKDPITPYAELQEIRALLNAKQTETLKNKYLSAFQVDKLIKKLAN